MKNAVKLDPDNVTWQVRLAQYQADAGHFVDTANTVRAIEATNPNPLDLPTDLRKQLDAIRIKIGSKK